MKILHIMLSRGLGGIEQVFLDYTAMLRAENITVIPVIHPESALRNQVPDGLLLPNFGKWDVVAMLRLRRMIKQHRPDCIITHGNRALSLCKRVKGDVRMFPVAHNYWLDGFKRLPRAIAITEDVAAKLRGFGVKDVAVIPNTVQCPDALPAKPTFRSPTVIGTMGRMVHKKGFDLFLNALSTLKEKGFAFKAIIGGSGEEEAALKQQAEKLKLDVEFLGWVKDKAAFFNALDIFCLPSRSEPFGIVLLEAFASGTPVVSTRNEGASQIATHTKDVLLYDENNLAEGLEKLLREPHLSSTLRENAFTTAQSYQPHIIGKKLAQVITDAQGV